MTYKKILHVGLPKTGSSAFQHVMKHNRNILAEIGVWCPPLQKLRAQLTRHVTRNEGGFSAQPFLGHNNILLSDEDILGKYYRTEEKKLYPHAQRNIFRFVDLLQWDEFDVWIMIRNYGDWIESCYLQWLKIKNREIISFDKYCEKISAHSLSWLHILMQLSEVANVSRIKVIPYEDYKKDNNILYSMVEKEFGLRQLEIPPAPRRNLSISDAGYRLIMSLADADQNIANRAREFVLKELREGDLQKPVFLSRLERRLLNEKYDKDISEIKNDKLKFNKIDVISIG